MTEQINYNGKQYPVRLSYKVLKHVPNSVDQENNEYFETMLYHGLKAGCEFEKVVMPFKMVDMEDILDECFFEFKEMLTVFMAKVKGEYKVQEPQQFENAAQVIDPKKKRLKPQ